MLKNFQQGLYYVLEDPIKLGKTTLYLNRAFLSLTFMMVLLIILQYDENLAEYHSLFFKIEFAVIGIFIIEYFARIWCSIYNPELTGSNAQKRWQEITSFHTIIDFIVIVAFLLSFVVDNETLSVLRAVRVLQIFKSSRYSPAMSIMFNVFKDNAKLLLSAFGVSMVFVVISATMINMVEGQSTTIYNALWYTIVTSSTVGYGDYVPATLLGKAFGVILIFIGVAITSVFMGIIGTGFYDEIQKRKIQFKNEIGIMDENELDLFRQRLGLPKGTCDVLVEEYNINENKVDQGELIKKIEDLLKKRET